MTPNPDETITNKETTDIKLKCLDIEEKSLQNRFTSLDKLDQKIWIFGGFYFLFFLQALSFINSSSFCLKLLFVIFSVIGISFLIKSFLVKSVDKMHPDLSHFINHDKLSYDRYIEDQFKNIKDIELSIRRLISSRKYDFSIALLFFWLSIFVILFIFLTK